MTKVECYALTEEKFRQKQMLKAARFEINIFGKLKDIEKGFQPSFFGGRQINSSWLKEVYVLSSFPFL